jgi:MbnP
MRISIILSITFALLMSTSCKKKGCTVASATNYNQEAQIDDGSCVYPETFSTEFNFIHELNGGSFVYDTILYTHPAGQQYSVQTLKYFVSNVVLYKASGDSVYLDVEHYVDAQDLSTTTLRYSQSIENTSYTGMAFIFGLDPAKNITGTYTNPPESLMEWPVPMGGGYHYMKMEGKYDSLGMMKNYNIHTGALMGMPYHFKVDLPQAFTVVNNEVHIEVKMELNNWFQNPAIFDFDIYGDAIMGNQTAQQVIQGNGINVFSLGAIY